MCGGRCWMVYDSLWFLPSHLSSGFCTFVYFASRFILLNPMFTSLWNVFICLWLREVGWVLASWALLCRAVAMATLLQMFLAVKTQVAATHKPTQKNTQEELIWKTESQFQCVPTKCRNTDDVILLEIEQIVNEWINEWHIYYAYHVLKWLT